MKTPFEQVRDGKKRKPDESFAWLDKIVGKTCPLEGSLTEI